MSRRFYPAKAILVPAALAQSAQSLTRPLVFKKISDDPPGLIFEGRALVVSNYTAVYNDSQTILALA